MFMQRSEEHTSELQSLMRTSYAVFCLKKKNKINKILRLGSKITSEVISSSTNNLSHRRQTKSNPVNTIRYTIHRTGTTSDTNTKLKHIICSDTTSIIHIRRPTD